MGELTIQRHSFDLAKNRLKEFSEKTKAELAIKEVDTSGGFLGLGSHKVTGQELNDRLEIIHKHFIAVNTTNNKLIKEFRTIYNALDALDKDYITSIVANVKAIEKTSNDVRVQQGTLKQHNEKLATQQNKLDAHQIEIDKTVSNVSKIVEKLKIFKEKLESYKHLTDIDKIWNDCKTIQKEIQLVSDNITKLSSNVTKDIEDANNRNKVLSEQVNHDILELRDEAMSFKDFFATLTEKFEKTANLLNEQIAIIEEISLFNAQLKNISHIDDVDSMWTDINDVKSSLCVIENNVQDIDTNIIRMQKQIEALDTFVDVLKGSAHLQDVDDMWDDLIVIKENLKKIDEYIKRNDENIKKHQDKLDILSNANVEQKQSIDFIHKKISEAETYAVDSRNLIVELEAYKKKLSVINHLKDVDVLWENVEQQTIRLSESKKRDEDILAVVQQNRETIEKMISDAEQKNNDTAKSLTKKIKIAYWIAGSSVGLAVVEAILILTKVI